jgi:hypothetical protein
MQWPAFNSSISGRRGFEVEPGIASDVFRRLREDM